MLDIITFAEKVEENNVFQFWTQCLAIPFPITTFKKMVDHFSWKNTRATTYKTVLSSKNLLAIIVHKFFLNYLSLKNQPRIYYMYKKQLVVHRLIIVKSLNIFKRIQIVQSSKWVRFRQICRSYGRSSLIVGGKSCHSERIRWWVVSRRSIVERIVKRIVVIFHRQWNGWGFFHAQFLSSGWQCRWWKCRWSHQNCWCRWWSRRKNRSRCFLRSGIKVIIVKPILE